MRRPQAAGFRTLNSALLPNRGMLTRIGTVDPGRMTLSSPSEHEDFTGFLGGIRVLEIGDELGEYCGKVLAGLGADVVRVEPPGGEVTRRYGPFYHDVPDPARSLY